MSTAVAPSQTCGCGCGNAVTGRRFLNARHKQRAAPKVYPHYVSSEIREVLCVHGNVVSEHLHRWPYVPGQGVAAPVWITLVGCPDCSAEERARLEKRKPVTKSACEARTCGCMAPKCKDCGRPMTMGPGSLGWHSWICTDIAQVEDKEAVTGITAKPLVLRGTHRSEKWTSWRE